MSQEQSVEKRGSGRRKMRHPCRSPGCSYGLGLERLAAAVSYLLAEERERQQLQSEAASSAHTTNHSMQGSSSVDPNNNKSLSAKNDQVSEPSTVAGKNLKRKKLKKELERTNPSKKHKKNVEVLDQQPELPTAFKEKIQELEGCEVKLVIQKELFKSDLNPNLGRFSIPIKQIREEAKNLLTQSEESSLDEREGNKKQRLHGLQVLVLDPCLKHCNMCLKKWTMKKTEVYNITSGWNDVVRNNDLKVEDMVQLWSFRSMDQLCFAIVKLQEAST